MLTRIHLSGPWGIRIGARRVPVLAFQPGVNLLVGPNGSGKSSVLSLVLAFAENRTGKDLAELLRYVCVETSDEIQTKYIDCDRHDTRLLARVLVRGKVMEREPGLWSHGEVQRLVLGQLMDESVAGHLLLLDEPDQALDLDGVLLLLELLRRSPAAQIVASVSHPLLVLSECFQVVELEPGYRERVLEVWSCWRGGVEKRPWWRFG